MWLDNPVPLSDGEKWRSSEVNPIVFVPGGAAFHIFNIIHWRSCLAVHILPPSFKRRRKETEGCHKTINTLVSGNKICMKHFHKFVWITCISSTYYLFFYLELLWKTYFIALAGIASNKWSGLESKVSTRPSVLNPQKVNEAWNYINFCVMASLQPHLCAVSCRETTPVERQLWQRSRAKVGNDGGSKSGVENQDFIFNMIWGFSLLSSTKSCLPVAIWH